MIKYGFKTIYYIESLVFMIFLYKMKKSDTDNCKLYGEHSETITHLLSKCTKSISLWENLLSWIQSSINIRIKA